MLERITCPISRITANEAVMRIWKEHNVRTVEEAKTVESVYIAEGYFDGLWNMYKRGGATTMGNYASDQKNTRCFSLKLSRNTDKDLIKHLEQQENIQAYIKQLIREDMKRTSR